MRTTSTADRCDSRIATDQYESLRANALGTINGAAKLTLFLRDGMSAWLRGFGKCGDDRGSIHREPSPVMADADSHLPAAELVSILTDAVLDATKAAGYLGGRR